MPKSFRIQSGSSAIAFGALGAVDDARVLVLDGGMGHELKKRGVQSPLAAGKGVEGTFLQTCLANLDEKDAVKALHKDYVVAGADVLTTNTFVATNHHLRKVGLEDRQAEILEASCDLCIEAIDEAKEQTGKDQMVLLAGSLPPLRESYEAKDLPEELDLAEEYSKVIDALNPCVDLFIAETLSAVAEVRAVCRALSGMPRPLFLSFSIKDDGSNQLRSGEPLSAALAVAAEHSFVRGLLVNCSSPRAVATALPLFKEAAGKLAEEAGAVVRCGGYANVFKKSTQEWLGQGAAPVPYADSDFDAEGLMTPAAYAREVKAWVDAGATVVGGCCGTGPAHVAAIRAALG